MDGSKMPQNPAKYQLREGRWWWFFIGAEWVVSHQFLFATSYVLDCACSTLQFINILLRHFVTSWACDGIFSLGWQSGEPSYHLLMTDLEIFSWPCTIRYYCFLYCARMYGDVWFSNNKRHNWDALKYSDWILGERPFLVQSSVWLLATLQVVGWCNLQQLGRLHLLFKKRCFRVFLLHGGSYITATKQMSGSSSNRLKWRIRQSVPAFFNPY